MSPLDSRILDINSEHLGVSVDTLMDNAGRALADFVVREFGKGRVLIVCGSGNNGGDGLSAAYHLKKHRDTAVAFVDSPDNIRTEASRRRFSMLKIGPKLFKDMELDEYDVVLDCVLGIGISGGLRDGVKEYVRRIGQFKGTVISADVPTGFGTDDAVVPEYTVTFHDIKEGMNEDNSGRIVIADIGIPEDAYRLVGPGDMLRYPIPKEDSHKGQNGRLLVIGGGPYIGAPGMSAMAALRTGADLVHIATPSRSFLPIACMSPSFIMHELPGDVLMPEHVSGLIELSDKADAVLIGPGLGRDDRTMSAVSNFLNACERPVLVDADAIHAVGSAAFRMPAVITPHQGELGSLLNGGFDTADDYARNKGNAVIVSKGRIDRITDGRRVRNNITGTAAMTAGGTGDALAGIIAGLMSKGMGTFDAACLGVYMCGRAGERAFDSYSYGMTAQDLIECIPSVIKEHLR